MTVRNIVGNKKSFLTFKSAGLSVMSKTLHAARGRNNPVNACFLQLRFYRTFNNFYIKWWTKNF